MDYQSSRPADELERSLVAIAIEGWRFAKTFARMLDKLDAGEGARYVSQHRYYLRRLQESLDHVGMRIVDLEGSAYDPGMAATALNIADFGPNERLLVDQMIEPIIMGPNGLVRPGTLILRRVEL